MNVRTISDFAKNAAAAVFAVAFVATCSVSVVSQFKNDWRQRNDKVYLIPQAYNPLNKGVADITGLSCYSPAACEPSSKPRLRYFALLTEHQVREWGLDPAHERPASNNIDDYDLN